MDHKPYDARICIGRHAYQVWEAAWFQRLRAVCLALAGLGVTGLPVELLLVTEEFPRTRAIGSGDLSLQRVLLWGLPAAGTFLDAVSGRNPKPSWMKRGWRRAGDVSYSVCLIHTSVIIVLGSLLARLPFAVPGAGVVLVCAAAGLGASLLFHRPSDRTTADARAVCCLYLILALLRPQGDHRTPALRRLSARLLLRRASPPHDCWQPQRSSPAAAIASAPVVRHGESGVRSRDWHSSWPAEQQC